MSKWVHIHPEIPITSLYTRSTVRSTVPSGNIASSSGMLKPQFPSFGATSPRMASLFSISHKPYSIETCKMDQQIESYMHQSYTYIHSAIISTNAMSIHTISDILCCRTVNYDFSTKHLQLSPKPFPKFNWEKKPTKLCSNPSLNLPQNFRHP